MQLHNKAVLITSGAKRLGFYLAQESLDQGFDVVLHYRSHREEAVRWLSRNKSFRDRAAFVKADLDGREEEVLLQALRKAPKLCGLVNNASIFMKGDLLDLENAQRLLRTNTLIPLRLCDAFRKHVGQGWIVNITDAKAEERDRPFQNYRLSKRLLGELTELLAVCYGPAIRVNAVAPGAMLPSSESGEKGFKRLRAQVPLKEVGRVDSLRRAFAHLIEDTYATGQTMFVDGGWRLT